MTDRADVAPLETQIAGLLDRGLHPRDLVRVRSRAGEEGRRWTPSQAVAALDRHLRGRLPVAGGAGVAEGAGLLVAGRSFPTRLDHAWGQGGPLWLHHRGATLTDDPHVAVVGTRQATLDGLTIARRMAADLGRGGVVVVSGMARGIDQAAHRGALEVGGRTVGVLGLGLDVDYPAGSGALRDAVAASGGLLTEYPPGHGVRHPSQFIARNRILVGLCDAVVVVEAGRRSGALNSATWAAAFGRDVLVVPASPSNPAAAGSLGLLHDGATPVRDAGDVLAAMGLAAPADPHRTAADGPPADGGDRRLAEGPGQLLLPLLGTVPASPSGLAQATGLTARQVLIGLSQLEDAGCAIRTADGAVRRS